MSELYPRVFLKVSSQCQIKCMWPQKLSGATRAAEQPFYSRDLVKDAVQGQPIGRYLDQDQRGGMEGCI